ncbi:hypothetical protein [Ktedonospora formicarum]|uniref:Uncharacterized protein n=1 Tax=Ktedonospora formicarum TaxID=2778364 RepID=A0A8J3MPZ6_9CHLR|nr:hypothetical protein [Ktedonospora formicarum]GHO44337.1 hypothetical protein KSX_25000 [Ktedonospora formicarum]
MLSSELVTRLHQHGIIDSGEVALREELEKHAETYTLIRLAAWPARRWKCHYRLMMGDNIHDAQSAPEAYALALLSLLEGPSAQAEPQPSHS